MQRGGIYQAILLYDVDMDMALQRSDTEMAALARYFRVLGDPTRLEILLLLLGGDKTVSDLVAKTGAPQSRISNHLACLKWCRVVKSERNGRWVTYRIVDPRIRDLIATAGDLANEHSDHLATCSRIGPEWT